MSKILITGASGLIGTELSSYLLSKGFEVVQLSRRKSTSAIKTYLWDLERNYIETGALNNIDHVVHLAGAGIADKRWTAKRKQEIIDSRVKSAKLLFNEMEKLEIKPKSFISASAVGYYGAITSEKIYSEDDKPGSDFVANVCMKWEESTRQFSELGIRTVQLRFGVVLSPKGGALKKMLLPTKLGFGSALGSGKQFFPWIHISDAINVVEKSIKDEQIRGTYNLVSPSYNDYDSFAKTLAKVLNKPYYIPNVPKFALKLVYGEMANIILEGSRISSKKLIDSGFDFNYPNLSEALSDLLDS
jgi:uncharacterized protein (TIGR01777 family)